MQIRPSYHLAGASPLPLGVRYLLTAAPVPCSHSSSTYHLVGVSVTLDMEYLLTAAPALHSRQRWRSYIQLAKKKKKKRLGADCGSDRELLIAKFRLKLKKVGKTSRPLSYDLNKIPYDYIVELTNRFKGLDLIARVSD